MGLEAILTFECRRKIWLGCALFCILCIHYLNRHMIFFFQVKVLNNILSIYSILSFNLYSNKNEIGKEKELSSSSSRSLHICFIHKHINSLFIHGIFRKSLHLTLKSVDGHVEMCGVC